jgi:hypothetical protein
MSLSSTFTSRFSKKGIFLRDFETFVNQQSQSIQTGDFLVDYDIPEKFAKMFTRQELTSFLNEIFTNLQFVKNINLNATAPNVDAKTVDNLNVFEYCFYKVETTSDFKKADIICSETDNWIGVKAKFHVA